MGSLKALVSPCTRVTQVGAMALLCCLPPSALAAKDHLFEGERLYAGEFLTSENGRFQMGFNEQGELEIVDLKPKANSKSFIDGWDGKTYWEARFTPEVNLTKARLFPLKMLPPEERRCDPDAWRGMGGQFQAYCYGDLMHKFKLVEGRPSYKVRGGSYLSLREPVTKANHNYISRGIRIVRKALFRKTMKPIEITIWSPHSGVPSEEVFLYLENSGRAIVFSEKGLHWCSCPYCDDWGEGYLPLRADYFNFAKQKTNKTNIDLLEMPHHKRSAEVNKAGGAAAAASAAAQPADTKADWKGDDGTYQALAQRAKAIKAEMLAASSKK